MEFKTQSSPFIAPNSTLSKFMLHVIIALIPGTVIYTWFFGYFIVINIFIAVITAILAETVIMLMRKRNPIPIIMDMSGIITAWLLALSFPTLLPWWMTIIGVLIAIVFAKHLYGGIGQNIFNPAMVGYAFVMIAFPREMTQWSAPLELLPRDIDFTYALKIIFETQGPSIPSGADVLSMPTYIDGLTMPTPLDQIKTLLNKDLTIQQILTSPMFNESGLPYGWGWVSLGWFVGGGYLIWKRVITWHIPVTMILSLSLFAGLMWLIDSQTYANPLIHLFSGSVIIAAFFIATDPVSAPTSNRGRVLYAIGIALLVYIIRVWGGYPDAIAFAVILMNMCAPLIDYYIRTIPFGRESRR